MNSLTLRSHLPCGYVTRSIDEPLHDVFSHRFCSAGANKSTNTNKMAAKEKGAAVDVLEKRISELERRVISSEEDVLNLKGSSVIILLCTGRGISPNLWIVN